MNRVLYTEKLAVNLVPGSLWNVEGLLYNGADVNGEVDIYKDTKWKTFEPNTIVLILSVDLETPRCHVLWKEKRLFIYLPVNDPYHPAYSPTKFFGKK